MNLLTEDESQQPESSTKSIPNPPIWQSYPQQLSPRTLNSTKNIMLYIAHHSKTSFHKVTMPQALRTDQCLPHHPPHQHSTPLSTPFPQPNNNLTNNESDNNSPKRPLKEDHQLVKLWINLTTNPITRVDQKKSDF